MELDHILGFLVATGGEGQRWGDCGLTCGLACAILAYDDDKLAREDFEVHVCEDVDIPVHGNLVIDVAHLEQGDGSVRNDDVIGASESWFSCASDCVGFRKGAYLTSWMTS